MYLTRRFYIILTVIIAVIGFGYILTPLFIIGRIALLCFVLAFIADIFMLYRTNSIEAKRQCSDRFSNGEDNKILIHISSKYAHSTKLDVIDEIPFIFQRRDIDFKLQLQKSEEKDIIYHLRPTKRGKYSFGNIRVFVRNNIGLVKRRYTCGKPEDIKVYPAFQMLHRYELLAINNKLQEFGIKRIRRIGMQTEFEHIREYVKDDDYRTINWKATAHRHQLMVNVYQDEKSQQIFNVIDKGRVMQQSFEGMTLLDYSINASLVLSYIVMRKEDKAGLVTFDDKIDTFVQASRHSGHMQTLLDNLYNQQTTFGETDFSVLCVNLNKLVSKRSLMIIYTNFANMISMKRQLSFLQQLSKRHKVLVVFFKGIELENYINSPSTNTEDYYRHVIAEKYEEEKRFITATLQIYGIYTLLTSPGNLSINVINKYLEMKTRQTI